MRIPKTNGARADLLGKLQKERYALQRKVDDIKKQEKTITDLLLASLPKDSSEGVAGKVTRVTIVRKQVPKVADWDKFYGFIKRKGRFDLLQRRVADKAVRDMWDDKKAVPGVESLEIEKLSITKK